MPILPLTPQVFSVIASLVEEKIGMRWKPADAALFASKLSGRVEEAGFDSMMDYYYYLRYDPTSAAEMDAMIDALVVNETYFFREADPLEVVATQILPPIVSSGRRPRVWCAACSTGEEPLTLAMLLARRGVLDGVDIVASDLSLRALDRARSGEYGRRSLRSFPDWPRGRWIDIVGERARVAPELVRAIRWERVNLVDPAALTLLGTFDVIICRNVLIYFSDATTKRVVGDLAGMLTPGGTLVVGVSESLLRVGAALVCEERGGAFLYRKAAAP